MAVVLQVFVTSTQTFWPCYFVSLKLWPYVFLSLPLLNIIARKGVGSTVKTIAKTNNRRFVDNMDRRTHGMAVH